MKTVENLSHFPGSNNKTQITKECMDNAENVENVDNAEDILDMKTVVKVIHFPGSYNSTQTTKECREGICRVCRKCRQCRGYYKCENSSGCISFPGLLQ